MELQKLYIKYSANTRTVHAVAVRKGVWPLKTYLSYGSALRILIGLLSHLYINTGFSVSFSKKVA